ncbi:MAG: hypothetical protein WCS26_07505 [Arcobacteraceae bacterium]|jgi:hypothetical protein
MRKKTLIMVLGFFIIGAVSAIAGTTDTLGMSGLWAKVQAILTDQYLNPIIVTIMIAVAVFRAYKEHPFQGLMIGGLALIIGQISSISTAIAGAMI